MSHTTQKLRQVAPRLIAELGIIVLGVLVALWVDAWRQDRSTADAQTHLMASLATELAANAGDLEQTIRRSEVVVSALRQLAELHPGKTTAPSADSLGFLFTQATSYHRVRPSFGAYDAMVATGRAQLLPNPDLAQRLARHRAELERGQGDESYAERAFEHLVSTLRAHGGWFPYMPESVSARIAFPPAPVRADPVPLFRDPAFLDALFTRVLYEDNIVTFYRAQLAELHQTLELLRSWR